MQHGDISSDEENEASLDVSSQSDCEGGTWSESDVDVHTQPLPCTRAEHREERAAQVCALY